MRTLLIVTFALLFSFTLFAQDIRGQWNGILKVQGTELRLVFNIAKTDDGYTSTMDSPNQGAMGISVTKTTFDNPKIKFEVSNIRMEYVGELIGGEIIGTFKQGGLEFPMNLSRNATEKKAVKRPQEPTKPYPYYSEDVTFDNARAKISLAGTLTLPSKEGKYPVVILISGSGPQNRDEELLGHKPFLVISDYLTRNGIGVLRYDDRGVGESKGDFSAATSADFATDVESAIAYLKTRKDINTKKIGLIGHSEGGLIAPIVASRSKDVNFIVMLAGTGIRGDKLLLMQQELISKVIGVSDEDIKKMIETNGKVFEIVLKSKDYQKLKTDVKKILSDVIENDPTTETPNGMTKEDYIDVQVEQITSPWMQYFIKYDPAPTLRKVKCPVLAINGKKDLQVPSKENLEGIKTALAKGGNNRVTTIEFENLNHLFQESETGAPAEYATIEQTFSPMALEAITMWIIEQIK